MHVARSPGISGRASTASTDLDWSSRDESQTISSLLLQWCGYEMEVVVLGWEGMSLMTTKRAQRWMDEEGRTQAQAEGTLVIAESIQVRRLLRAHVSDPGF